MITIDKKRACSLDERCEEANTRGLWLASKDESKGAMIGTGVFYQLDQMAEPNGPRAPTSRSCGALTSLTRPSLSRRPHTPRRAALRRATLGLTLALAATACAAPSHYAGIDLRPGAAPTELQALAQCAMSGDSARAGCSGGAAAQKAAQLDLGIVYEEGKGVPPDPKRARALYRQAAAQTGGTIYVYVPATRKGGRGYTMPVDMGPVVPGLVAAKGRSCGPKVSKNGRGHSLSEPSLDIDRNYPPLGNAKSVRMDTTPARGIETINGRHAAGVCGERN